MKPIAMALAGLAMVCASSHVLADMYKCVDASGHVTYSNVGGKECKRLIADTVTTVPPPKAGAKQASPADFPKVGGNAQKARDDDRRRILETELGNEQKALEQAKAELATQEGIVLPEERNVMRVVDGKQVPGGINGAKVEERLKPFRDRVALHERNLEALRKEIANLR